MKVANPTSNLVVKAIEDGFSTSPEIAKRVDLPILNVAMTLRRMYKEGLVKRAGKKDTGKGGNPPTQWELNYEPLLKKFTAVYCENDHLFGVVLQDIFRLPIPRKAIEFSREQGYIKDKVAIRNCFVCNGELKI